MRSLSGVTCLAFEGGGSKGTCYLAILEALDVAGSLARIRRVAGTSAGAITAMLVAMNASLEEVGWVARQRWRKRILGPWRPMTYRLARAVVTLGLYRSDGLASFVRELMLRKGFDPASTTFESLFLATGRELSVVAIDLDSGDERVFNTYSTPSVLVADAVAASSAIPGLFEPITIDGCRYIDGGLTANHPLGEFASEPAETVLGVRVDTPEEISGSAIRVRSLLGLYFRLFSIARRVANRSHIPKELWERTIVIDSGRHSGTDFDLSPEAVADLIARGKNGVTTWLQEL